MKIYTEYVKYRNLIGGYDTLPSDIWFNFSHKIIYLQNILFEKKYINILFINNKIFI